MEDGRLLCQIGSIRRQLMDIAISPTVKQLEKPTRLFGGDNSVHKLEKPTRLFGGDDSVHKLEKFIRLFGGDDSANN